MKKIALPPTSADVTLEDLKYEDGKPVEVHCEPVEPEVIFRAWGTLPAPQPLVGAPKNADQKSAEEKLEDAVEVAKLAACSVPIIEAGAFVPGDNGAEVPLSTLMRVARLSIRDRSSLVAAISRLSGVGSATAESIRFRYDHGGGLVNGAGVGSAGSEVREDAMGDQAGGA